MSSNPSSDSTSSEDEVVLTHRKRIASTPRTPLSPKDAFPNLDESKTHRSNSFVRFQGLEVPTESEDPVMNRRVPRSPILPASNTHDDDTGKLSAQFQSQLLERIENLESQLQYSRRQSNSWDKGDESSERTGLNTEIQWMSWVGLLLS